MSYQPASERAPGVRDSNPCQREGGKEENTVSSRQSVSVGEKGDCWPAVAVRAGRALGWAVLTAQGSAWARRHGGCTACTGRRGRPGWPGSPVLTTGQPPAGAGTRSSLKQHTPSVQGARPTGCCSQHWEQKGYTNLIYQLLLGTAPTLLFRCLFDHGLALQSQPAVFSCSPHHLGSTSVLCGQCTSHQLSS